MLYTLYSDSTKYRRAVIDSDYVASIVGGLREGRLDDRIDVNHQPRRWQGVFPDPIPVTFPLLNKDDENKSIPDIAELQGRLFLNDKAYQVLKSHIENDGDFIPARSGQDKGYIFTPLHTAEQVEGVDTVLSKKNEWEDVDHLVFIEGRVKDFFVFRSDYTACMRLYCQQSIKDIIESNQLTGLYITSDLANIFPEERNQFSEKN